MRRVHLSMRTEGIQAFSKHSRPQSLRSFWPAAGICRNRELWEQPFQACAIAADYVRPDFVISKWLLPELSIPAAGQKDRRLWERQCFQNGYGVVVWAGENDKCGRKSF